MTEEEHTGWEEMPGEGEFSRDEEDKKWVKAGLRGVWLMRTEKLTHAKSQVKGAPESPTIGETSPRHLTLLFRNSHNSLNH